MHSNIFVHQAIGGGTRYLSLETLGEVAVKKFLLLGACLLTILASLSPVSAAQDNREPSPTPTPNPIANEDVKVGVGETIEQSEMDSFEADVRVLAAAYPEISVERVRRVLANQNAVSTAAGEIGASRIAWIEKSNQFAVETVVTLPGEGDPEAQAILQAAGAKVEVGARFSMSEQGLRSMAVSEALRELGYELSSVAPVAPGDVMRVQVPFGSAENGRIAQAIVERAPAIAERISASAVVGPTGERGPTHSDSLSLRASASSFELADIEIIEVDKSVLVVDETTMRGGQYMWTGVSPCTSGWTFGWAGYEGYMTAGHCMLGGEQLWDPAGSWDFGWWTWSYTPMDVGIVLGDPPNISNQWYASDTQLRTQGSVGIAGVNDTLCVYGRTSNTRFCSRTVSNVNECNSLGTCWLTRVTVDSGRSICPGDSGGGFSWGWTLYGVLISAGPAGSNSDCNANPSTNYTYEQYQPVHQIRDWLGFVPL